MSLTSQSCRLQTQWQQRLRLMVGHNCVHQPVRIVSRALSNTHNGTLKLFHDCQQNIRTNQWYWGVRPKEPKSRRGESLILKNFNTRLHNDYGVVNPPFSLQFRAMSSSRHAIHYARQRNASRGPDLRKCQSIEEIAQMAHDHLENMSPPDIAAFWTLASRFIGRNYRNPGGRPQQQQQQQQDLESQLESVLLRTIGNINRFRTRDLAQTALGFAKIVNIINTRGRGHLQGTPPQIIMHNLLIGEKSLQQQIIFQSIANASMHLLSEFEPRCLSSLAYANAIAGSFQMLNDGNALFVHIAWESIPLLGEFNSQGLANLVWSFEKVGASNPRLFEEVANTIVALDHLGEFTPQNLSNILLAFAKADESNPRLFRKVAEHIIDAPDNHLENFEPLALVNIVLAYATANESDTRLFKKVADHITALNNLLSFKPHELSNMLWAFAKAEVSHPRLFQKVADHIISLHTLGGFKPHALTNIIWSFSKAGESNPKLFKKMARHIVALDNLGDFKPRNLSDILLAFAKAEESNPQLFKVVSDHIVTLDNLGGFDEQALANLVWAYAYSKESNAMLFEKVADHIAALDNREGFKPQAVSDILWAFEKAEVSHPRLFKVVADHIVTLDRGAGSPI
eukprot:CAMPEP_0172313670 /NCGR_PEP_ID=MMETSP1058-20130122/20718_1 /TAXON_ID=83371 /ORGANISM="Detonula confervacea, Strain CCMP 353" /LENGTH=625 /DNA_ID=CAMNT_0013027365 /DNA_START=82 /DNA_END=1959 /DNA_ORIENTATION=+